VPHYAEWLRERSGAEKQAPAHLGSRELRPLEDAPGTYILDK
jgi:polyhydroxyalkanoate synthase